ncbi:MAG: hypothetical protein E7562_08065, partial [Ruminococcaceae bacterium]|nr:hypothetical protein [Oscillospiraceae bacterium]
MQRSEERLVQILMHPAVSFEEKKRRESPMKFYSKIDIGKLRASNQDDCRVSVLAGGAVLAVVCDGMGGANAGNVASEKAVCTITDYVSASYRAEMDNAAITRMIVGAINS